MKKLFLTIFILFLFNENSFAEVIKLSKETENEIRKLEKELAEIGDREKKTKKKIFSLTCEGEIVSKLYNNYSLFENKKEIS